MKGISSVFSRTIYLIVEYLKTFKTFNDIILVSQDGRLIENFQVQLIITDCITNLYCGLQLFIPRVVSDLLFPCVLVEYI